MNKERRIFTSESVTEGHPDKVCDQISDGVLDAILEKDPMARVACECATTTGLVLVMGEITTNCYVDIAGIARKTIEDIVFEPIVGALYFGEVKRIISNLGAFIELAPGKDAMCHIKDLEFKRTEKVEDVLKIGDMTWVKVMNVDDRGRIDLSRKDAMREKGLM